MLQWRSLASCLRTCADCALPSHAYRRRRPRGCLRKQCEVFLANQTCEAYATFPRYLRCVFNQWNASKFIAVSLEWIRHSRGIESTNQIFVGDWYPLPIPLPLKDGNQIILIKHSRIHSNPNSPYTYINPFILLARTGYLVKRKLHTFTLL